MKTKAFLTHGIRLAHVRAFIAVLLLATLTACNDTLNPTVSTGSTRKTALRISLTPLNPSVASEGSLQFTALIENTSNTRVLWSTNLGTISENGLYLAPKVTDLRTVVVTATSVADPLAFATANTTVLPAQSFKIATSSLAPGTSGTSYDATLSASGGDGPYQWTIASGVLPSGLQLNPSAGVISGVPSQTGTFAFTVSLKDAAANQATQALMLQVSPNSAGTFDGPAELPRVYLQTTLADTPAPGKTVQVYAGGDFQAALNSANCGDTISLQAGATFGGVYYFPKKACDDSHWVIVRTSAPDSSLPPENTRLTPCYAGVRSLPGRPPLDCTSTKNVLAKLIFTKKTGYGPVVFESGANHYRLLGLEVTRSAGTGVISDLITPDTGVPSDHIVMDRLWVHGTAQDETTRGAFLSGVTSVAVVDSFFTDFHCTAMTGSCVDSQAVSGGAGDLPMGPFKIVDNFLEASGENIIFGGSEATQTPTDIEIRRNHFFKPMTWMPGHVGFVGGADGNPFIVKNLFEIKNAQRVLFEANVLENNWGGEGQYGYSLLLTPKNPGGACPVCLVTDVTIRYSTISHVGGVFELANAASDSGDLARAGERYSIHDVIADDIDNVAYNGRGTFAQVSTVPHPNLQNIQINHVTAFQPRVMFNVGSGVTQKIVNFRFTNNIVNAGQSPFTTTGGGTANCAYNQSPLILLNACFAPYVFSDNAIIALPSSVPDWLGLSKNFFPADAAAIQFVDYKNGNGGDYHLLPTSPFKHAGTDGRDLGADVDSVLAQIAGVP